jgi:hypothetical protein
MTTITADRAFARSNDEQTSGSTFRTLTLAIATPVLAIALSWGVVDACAYTQHSLMGIYTISSTAT